MLKIFVVALHVMASLILTLFILLHAGRGGGLSDLLGGGSGSLVGSTVVERNLDRYTIVAASIFGITSVGLVFLFAVPR